MLEQTALETTQDSGLDEALKSRPPRFSGKSWRDGFSEGAIDRIDLHHVESTASSDGAFAARLERAIEAGLERDIAVTIEDHGTERPAAMIVPSVRLPEQIPAIPQRDTFLAYRISRRQRAERAEDAATRKAESADQRMIVPGRLTVLDLRAGVCRFSQSESAPYFFCGAPTGADAKPWCPAHHLVCFPPRS